METSQQENAQEVLQENNETPRVVQLVQPPEVLDEIAKAERRYREIVERENR